MPARLHVRLLVAATLVMATTLAVAQSTISNQGSLSYDADGNQTNEAAGVTNDPGTGAPNDATSFGRVPIGRSSPATGRP